MASGGNRDLFYDDIVKLSSKNEIILIDVREPAEIQETGKLPGSTHIPCNYLHCIVVSTQFLACHAGVFLNLT